MAARKVAVTLDERTVKEVDRWVTEGKFPNRSRAIQAAIDEVGRRQRRLRLAVETAKLDPAEEQALAEEFRSEPWPEY